MTPFTVLFLSSIAYLAIFCLWFHVSTKAKAAEFESLIKTPELIKGYQKENPDGDGYVRLSIFKKDGSVLTINHFEVDSAIKKLEALSISPK